MLSLVSAGMIALWRLPGTLIEPTQLDHVRAFDDTNAGCVLIVAAFDAGSFAVIDSCSHEWSGTGLRIELRRKLLMSRDGRTTRIGAFRVPYGLAAAGTGSAPARLELRSGLTGHEVPIEPLPAGFMSPAPIIDSRTG